MTSSGFVNSNLLLIQTDFIYSETRCVSTSFSPDSQTVAIAVGAGLIIIFRVGTWERIIEMRPGLGSAYWIQFVGSDDVLAFFDVMPQLAMVNLKTGDVQKSISTLQTIFGSGMTYRGGLTFVQAQQNQLMVGRIRL